MTLPLKPPLPPMEARVVEALPEGEGWQFEPKWDGFRCLAFCEGDSIQLQSKAGRPLERYFPDMVAALRRVPAERFVLDGEIVIPTPGGGSSFEALQLRLHPAPSRVQRLSIEQPATFAVFDLLVDARGTLLMDAPLADRRLRLEDFAARALRGSERIVLSPATRDRARAQSWLDQPRAGYDGVIAKRLESPYRSGDRNAMLKIKPIRTADCVVAGYRRGMRHEGIGSLLLGLYDRDGVLHHVGHTASLASSQRHRVESQLPQLEPKEDEPAGFTGRSPGGPSRWSAGRSSEWEPLVPKLVVEVEYRHWSGGRFRHGTHLLRERPDKQPSQCTFDQIPECRNDTA